MKTYSYYIHTFGCKMNQHDSASMDAMLTDKGFKRTCFSGEADIIIINTCTVTENTDRKERRIIRKFKRENPNAHLIVTGCYAERDPSLIDSFPEIDILAGNPDRERIGEIVEHLIFGDCSSRVFHRSVGNETNTVYFPLKGFSEHTRAFLKVQDGCDACCSYCVVPSVRGRSRSLPAQVIVEEASRIADLGFREIVLTGIHIGMYGLDIPCSPDLAGLVDMLVNAVRIDRIRISSIEPLEVSEHLIELIRDSGKVAEHLHIPLQSGSDDVLKAMNRPYSTNKFMNLLEKLRMEIPDICLGTDVIVGFPGESDGDFEKTVALIELSHLNYLHVFRYSKRPGTKAASMLNQIPPEKITSRSEILRDVSVKLKKTFREKFVGKELSCLSLEQRSDNGLIRALSGNYIEVHAEGNDSLLNKMLRIKIESTNGIKTYGKIIS